MWKILQIDAKKSRLPHCACGDDAEFGTGPNVFFCSLLGKSHECVDRRGFLLHFDKNIGSNGPQEGLFTR